MTHNGIFQITVFNYTTIIQDQMLQRTYICSLYCPMFYDDFYKTSKNKLVWNKWMKKRTKENYELCWNGIKGDYNFTGIE